LAEWDEPQPAHAAARQAAIPIQPERHEARRNPPTDEV